MRKYGILLALLAFFLVFVGPLFAGSAAAGGKGDAPGLSKNHARPANLPPGQEQSWEQVLNKLDKEYNVCAEHCGGNQKCLDRCNEVYNARWERESEQFMRR